MRMNETLFDDTSQPETSALNAQEKAEKPHHSGHRKRLRARLFQAGSESLPDYELLEVLLFAGSARGDVKPLAKALIKRFGSLPRVLSATHEELKNADVNEASAAMIVAVREASIRLLKDDVAKKPLLDDWQALLDYCQAAMGYGKTEQFRIFFLDRKNRLLADEVQQKGTVDHTPVYPREVAKRALELAASAIILVHNHPSGDPSPSKADIDMTRRIQQTLSPLSIMVHDHLIIGGNAHFSFASHGLL